MDLRCACDPALGEFLGGADMPDNLYKRGKVFWGRVQVAGEDCRRSLQTSDRAEAKRRLQAWLKEVSHLRYHGEDRLSWKAAVLRYTEEVLPSSVKPSTATRYSVSLWQVAKDLEDLYVDEITTRTIAKIVTSAKARAVTNATIRRDLTAVSRVLAACVAWGLREDNPARAYDRSIIREMRPTITLPTDEEIEAVVAAAPPMLGRIIRVAWTTGMRQEEIVSLTRSQVRKDGIYLPRTKTGEPRIVPLDDPICRDAVGTLAGTPLSLRTSWVFWHGKGERYVNVAANFVQLRDRVNRKGEKAGEPAVGFRFHDLRHRFAVDYLTATRSPQMKRGDVYRLAEILGHSSVKTTEAYLKHVTPLGTEAGTAKGGSAQQKRARNAR
jgi:integrase